MYYQYFYNKTWAPKNIEKTRLLSKLNYLSTEPYEKSDSLFIDEIFFFLTIK